MRRRDLLASAALPVMPLRRARPRGLVYLAGPLFSVAERTYLSTIATAIRETGRECFVPHEHELPLPVSTDYVFALDRVGLARAEAMLAWVDGPDVDSGTACEIGIFAELCRRERWRQGIAALGTDLRQQFRKGTAGGGMNLFVAGCIESAGVRVASISAALEWLGRP